MKPWERARWVWVCWLATCALCTLGLALVVGLALRGANLYPRFAATAAARQREGAAFWEHVCGHGEAHMPGRYAKCDKAATDATVSVRTLALEQTLAHLWGEVDHWCSERLLGLNPLSWLQCHSGSSCHFVLFKALETLTGHFVLTLLGVILGLTLVLWALWRGPYHGYARYEHEWLMAQQKRCDLPSVRLLTGE